MTEGELVAIHIANEATVACQSLDSVAALAGRGLAVDRKCRAKSGEWGRQVTIIDRESVEAAARDGDIALTAAETRRNLVTTGVPLNDLVGREFSIGTVRMRGTDLCHPCTYLEGLIDKPVTKLLDNRGGLCAQILNDGEITVGDRVTFPDE